MSNGLPPSSLLGKRKKKKEPNPNPLFCQWLTEWRDEAKEKGWKSEYIYSKALNSLKKYPLPLSTGKECKILQNFGDKICKMLDERLLKHTQEQENSATVKDLDAHFPSASSWNLDPPRVPVTVHEISDASDDDTSPLHNHKPPVLGNSDTVHINNRNSKSVKLAEKKSIAQTSSGNWMGLASKNAFETVDVDDDDAVSFLGRVSPVKFASLDSDDDDLPELPRLPSLVNSDHIAGENVNASVVKTISTDDSGGIGLDIATNVARVTHSVSDSEEDEAGQAVPVPPQRPARRGGGRQPREYVPAYRSGPYAILLTLYRQAQDPNFRGFMTKAELCRAAQPLADKSFTVADPGSRYTAWSSVSTLVRKGYLTKESSPAKYHLTDEGYELAHRLEEVERQNAAGQRQNGGDGPDTPGDGPRGGGFNATARRDDEHGSPVTDTAQPVNQQAKSTPQKNRSSQNKNSDVPANVIAASSSSGTDQTHEAEYVGEEMLPRPENDQCILIDDCDEDRGDSDDELPALTLPSLAERVKSSSSTASLTLSGETPGNRKLQYWYVAEDDKLVFRKDQASVEINETGVSFLVKINYQQLLQSGCLYRLDMSRPLGDDFVFAYLSDMDCSEVAEPPKQTEESAKTTAAAPPAPQTTATSRSSATVTKSRRTHDISDSDSDTEQGSSKPDSTASTLRQASSSRTAAKLTKACSSVARNEVHSLPTVVLNRKASTIKSTAGSADAGDLKFPRVPSLSSSQESAGSGISAASSSVEDFVLWPGTFEVVLCVDNREFYGSQSSCKTLLPDLIKSGVTCDLRLLSVGDLVWVAREKAPPGHALGMMGKEAQLARRELVLNYVVERKRMDDFVSSMIGGRLKEQKFRLKHSGLQEKIILIESYGSLQHFSISEDRIKQAIANTEIIDGFTVKQTSDSKETAAYLTLMTRYLQSYYQNKTLRSCSRDTIRELGIRFDVSDIEQMLMPFDHFNQASLKNKPLTVMELFAKQLIQLWGMSAEKARAIVDRYPTPTRLFEAYAACTSEKERDSLLATLKFGKNLRNLGIALSRQVAQLYTSKTLT